MMQRLFSRYFRRKPLLFRLRLNASSAHAPARSIDLAASAGHSLLLSALDQGVAFPNLCREGVCGSCKCRLLHGQVKQLSARSYVLTPAERRANVILACRSFPLSDVELAVVLEPEPAGA